MAFNTTSKSTFEFDLLGGNTPHVIVEVQAIHNYTPIPSAVQYYKARTIAREHGVIIGLTHVWWAGDKDRLNKNETSANNARQLLETLEKQNQ